MTVICAYHCTMYSVQTDTVLECNELFVTQVYEKSIKTIWKWFDLHVTDAERERNVMATRKLHIVRLWNLFNFCDEIPNICRAELNSKWQQSDPLE